MELVVIDKNGRLVLPKRIRKKLGLTSGGVLTAEIDQNRILLKPTGIQKSPARAIAEMSLPVDVWEKVEKEIEEGAMTS